MTASNLRGLLTTGPVLPCSPVEFVSENGRRFEVIGRDVVTPHTQYDPATQRLRPASVPVVTLVSRPV